MMKDQDKNKLPPRMRKRLQKSGKTYFYYMAGANLIPLGADYVVALKKYQELEIVVRPELQELIMMSTTFAYVANRYFKEVVPNKALSTQKDNKRELKNLLAFFNDPPVSINQIQPVHVAEYLQWRREAKTRANREVALLSHIFNMARTWGYTANENPVTGVPKYKEQGREVYVTDDLFLLIYEHADKHVQNIMMYAYLTGQRVTDCRKLKLSDIKDDEIWVSQEKTDTRLRIRLVGALQKLIIKILAERGRQMHEYVFIGRQGQPLTHDQLRYGVDKARRLAKVKKADFQLRDLRAKAGTDKEESQGIIAAQAMLGHKSPSMTRKYVRNRKGKLVDPTALSEDHKLADL